MIIKKISKNKKGFVLLFAVMLSSIILAISLGVANIAFKEVKFSTSTKDTGDAFFAADVGAECVLYNDKSTINAFPQSGGPTSIQCAGLTINFITSSPSWNFVIPGLGSTNQSCAKVNVTKTFSPYTTVIRSKGYNTGDVSCNSSNPNNIERVLELNY